MCLPQPPETLRLLRRDGKENASLARWKNFSSRVFHDSLPLRETLMNHLKAIIFALFSALCFSACDTPSKATSVAPPMQLQVFKINPTQTQKVSASLERVLGKQGSVSIAAPGKLLVLAPESLQASIARSLAEIDEHQAPTLPPQPVKLSTWLVEIAIEGSPTDERLAQLQPALDALVKEVGPSQFALRTELLLQGLANGEIRRVNDQYLNLDAQLSVASEQVVLGKLRIATPDALFIEVETLLPFGQFVVIGRGTARGDRRTVVIVRADKI
jgi:hypothetical protein